MPFIRALSPTRNASPLARRRRRRRAIQILTGFWLLVSLVGVGFALVQGSILPVNSALAASLPASGPIVPNSTVIIDYSYDPLYRLTEADYNSVGQVYTYTYDAANNRLAAGLNGTQVTTYTYDIANRLTQVDEQAYAYDNSGNLLSDGTYTYTYDSANRLIQLVDTISTKAYEYNGDGVRVAQIEDGLRTDYVQDVAAPLPQVLTARQGGTVSTYLRGLGLIGEQRAGTGPLAGPATWQYTLPDALGSVRQVVDGQGVVTVGRHYDPFGGILMAQGTGRSAYGFAGEEQDTDTEQLFLRARTYNPSTGRFLQQDDVLGTANQPRTLHRYTYSFNNPVNYTDPNGHMPSFTDMLCGAVDFARTAAEFVTFVGQEVVDFMEPFMDKVVDPIQDFIYNAVKDTAFMERLRADARANPGTSMLAMLALDTAYDAVSLIMGHDLFTGEKLSHGEELFIFGTTFGPLIVGGVLKYGGKLLGAAGDMARRGVDAAGDSISASKRADQLQAAARLQGRMDTFVNRTDDVLQRRLADFVERGNGAGDVGRTAVRRGDDLTDAAWGRRLEEYVTRSNKNMEGKYFIGDTDASNQLNDFDAVDNFDSDVAQAEKTVVEYLYKQLNEVDSIPDDILFDELVENLKKHGANIQPHRFRKDFKMPGAINRHQKLGEGHFTTAIFQPYGRQGDIWGTRPDGLQIKVNAMKPNRQEILIHEIMHWVSWTKSGGLKGGVTGFVTKGNEATLFLNEGVTQYLTRKIGDNTGLFDPARSTARLEEVKHLEELIDKVGLDERQLIELYINNDLDGLRTIVDNKSSQGTFEKFLRGAHEQATGA